MKVYIDKRPFPFRSVSIWVVQELPEGKYNLSYDRTEPGKIKRTKDEQFSPDNLAPFIEIPFDIYEDIVGSIIDAAKRDGLRTENENLLEGKVVEMQNHIETLKRVTSLDNEIISNLLSKLR